MPTPPAGGPPQATQALHSPPPPAASGASGPAAGNKGRILLVDDNAILIGACARILRAAGLEVQTASDGKLATTLLQNSPFEAVFSDVSMPNMDGLQLLREVRRTDLDMPVVLMTGGPSTQAAITALEHGALRYLLKPVDPEQMASIAKEAVLMYRLAKSKREALKVMGYDDQQAGDLAGAEARFDAALGSLQLWVDPIISRRARACTAYEVICRSQEPSLNSWSALCAAAERMGQVERLGQVVRQAAAQAAAHAPGQTQLLVPLHPRQLFDEGLFAADAPLTALAQRVLLCLPDSSVLERMAQVPAQIERLRKLGFRLALTEVGTGSAVLSSFGQISFEMVKLSGPLAQDIVANSTKHKVLVSIVKLYQELRLPIIASGVRNVAERAVMVDADVDLMQGPYFAAPARTFARANVRIA